MESQEEARPPIAGFEGPYGLSERDQTAWAYQRMHEQYNSRPELRHAWIEGARPDDDGVMCGCGHLSSRHAPTDLESPDVCLDCHDGGRADALHLPYRQTYAQTREALENAVYGTYYLEGDSLVIGAFETAVVKRERTLHRSEDGVALIARERATHIARGYTPEHDAEHGDTRELLRGAIYYAARELGWSALEDEASLARPDWPFTSTGIEALAKAGSLIAAEIDRRAALAQTTDGTP